MTVPAAAVEFVGVVTAVLAAVVVVVVVALAVRVMVYMLTSEVLAGSGIREKVKLW